MPISVTCECGARLEIDEKFLGKEISCPDCQRPLPTKAPVVPPPLDLPDNRRTSGLAVLSLAVGLIGMFTIVGSLAAIGLGIFAMRVIGRSKKLDGLNLARAGVAVGGFGIVATAVMLFTPVGLDGFYRELVFAFLGRTNYTLGGTIESPNNEFTIKKPSVGRWGVFDQAQSQNQIVQPDALLLINLPADAYISCQHITPEVFDDEEIIQKKIIDQVRKSQLASLVGQLNGKQAPDETNVVAKKVDQTREVTFDVRLGRFDRRFLILYNAPKNHRQVKFLVGCARAAQFDRVQEQFREAFTGFVAK